MIKLTKGVIPQVLQSNGGNWTKNLLTFISCNPGVKVPETLKNKYNHPIIKSAVRLETSDKCMYCESKVGHTYPGDIEHIIPKIHYPRLAFTWKNLSFACYWCNHYKLDYLDKTCKLINPYTDDIHLHLGIFGPLIMHVNGSKRGEITHMRIKLNRDELIDRRREALDNLQNLIDKYHRESIKNLKAILRAEIMLQVAEDKEYSLCKQQYLKMHGII